jgi:tRNA dimethylallyltransferase
MRIAEELSGEIVSADSRQVYRHMDIGTAKPTVEEMALVPHHLIDIVNPDEGFSLAEYQRLAYDAILDIAGRRRLPLLVGGTGQYVWAVVEGWEIPKVAPDLEFRRQLEERAERGETVALYAELLKIDPEAAQKIDPRNVRRVIRALEVCQRADAPFSRLRTKTEPPFQTLVIGLTERREDLYHRVDARVDAMIEHGLVEEARDLAAMGFGFSLPAMSGIGYRQIGDYLQGKLDLESAVKRIKVETHRFVRHQYNWFRPTDERIKWYDLEDTELKSKAVAEIRTFCSAHDRLSHA